MHLPQEYWRKKTLYEIASGLGTPLSIDEVTQNRRFGLFARVLIDVDLSKKLFETVVVEREGHALSIEVQYEKQPSYCAHCKILGHSLHNCMKLGSTNKNDGPVRAPKKVSHVLQLDKNQVKNNLAGKKNDVNILTKNSTVEIVDVENLQNANSTAMHEIAGNFENSSAHDISGKEGTSGDMTVSPVIMKENDPSTLVLHNAFELLEADSALPSGKVSDMVAITSKDLHLTSTELDMCVSKDSGCFEKISNSEVPSEKRPTQFVASSSSNQSLKDVSGLQSCTMPASMSPGQTLALKSVEQAEKVQVLSPVKLVAPITTYNENLGPDKGKIQVSNNSNQLTAAGLKSFQILSKFWGDVVDSDNDTEKLDNVEPASTIKPGRKCKSPKNLEGIGSIRFTTRSDDDKDDKSFTLYVSNRQKKKNKLQSPRGSENECIQTRAKSGISKAYKS